MIDQVILDVPSDIGVENNELTMVTLRRSKLLLDNACRLDSNSGVIGRHGTFFQGILGVFTSGRFLT